jgi:hypothetical protein
MCLSPLLGFGPEDRQTERFRRITDTQGRSLLNLQMPVTLSVSDVPFSLRETPILT